MFWILGRKNWQANAPQSIPTRDTWEGGCTLVVHHTAGLAPTTRAGEIQEMRGIQRQHQRTNGWNDIGYNYVIMPSGRVWEGRGYNIVGAHTANLNTHTIGVSFAGNYETHKPTARSIAAYHLLVARLRLKGARITRTTGHKFMPGQATACPGKHLVAALRLK